MLVCKHPVYIKSKPHEWAVENITKVDFVYSTQEELFLKNRFDEALTIQYHVFIAKTT